MTFKKGQSGNPSGRPKKPKELREAQTMNQISVAQTLNKFMRLDYDELKAIAENPKTPALEMMISRVIVSAAKHGDHSRLNFIFDRMIGKVPDQIKLDAEVKEDITWTTFWGTPITKKE